MYKILLQIARGGIRSEPPPPGDDSLRVVHQRLETKVLQRFRGALAIRHVDAGSCNGCELEIHALSNVYYNLEGLGIKFVASPRHADLLLVTGPVSRHMEIALRRTYEAIPDPKLVVAVGDCGCGRYCGTAEEDVAVAADNGGIFGQTYATCGRVSNVIPVDVAVPGCPPTPLAIMQGILTAIEPERR
jgi:Ni,Fe-hydrogenase III small subunit